MSVDALASVFVATDKNLQGLYMGSYANQGGLKSVVFDLQFGVVTNVLVHSV
jgi:hypothetical protein